MFVIGTAGHIDHGKSVLVQALTGMDPDRLPEEKERGMTIDLGFAWLNLPSGQEVGIIDVPGHEGFIKNMLAGVGGIDMALLVIAANEGVMPQTREHLSIMDILDIRNGIVVITKSDLVDEEWLSLVRLDIEELIHSTTLSQAPIIAISALTGEGLSNLVSTIDRFLNTTEPKKDIGRPRLPIDRVFTIAGSGTIVTGTLINGSLSLGDEVEIVPPGLKSRLRGLQTHKTRINSAAPGNRVAANLVGIATSQLERGDLITKPGLFTPTTLLSVQLRLLGYLHQSLRHETTVSFHTGAAERMAKVRLMEKERLEPGEIAWAQLMLSTPVSLAKGDHFVIRSPMETLGGGIIIDSHAKRLRRFRPAIIQSLKVKKEGTTAEIIMELLKTKEPLELPLLIAACDLPSNEVESTIEYLTHQEKVMSIGKGKHCLLFTTTGWEHLAKEAITIVEEYHRTFPARSGIPKVEMGSRLNLGKQSLVICQRLVSEGVLFEEGLVVRLPSYQIRLNGSQQAKIDVFLKSLAQNRFSPSGEVVLEADLLNILIERQQVVKVNASVIFSTQAYNEMVRKVTSHIEHTGKVTLAEVRDLFKTSRKYAQAFLEYLDEKRITRRIGNERVLY
ncbi:selenocysteine-specific translation elongation factor [Chloroflexota bacterium]